MRHTRLEKMPALAATVGVLATLLAGYGEACTRAVYLGKDDNVMTARSMDWKVDGKTNLWAFPRGLQRTGQAGPESITWQSKYGSVIATGYDISTTDGLNEQGLSVVG